MDGLCFLEDFLSRMMTVSAGEILRSSNSGSLEKATIIQLVASALCSLSCAPFFLMRHLSM